MRIVFLTRSLEAGGAERQLLALAGGLARAGHQCSILSFYPLQGPPPEGIRFVHLAKRGRWDVMLFLPHLVRAIRRERPDVVHGYLSVPNVLIGLCRPLLPGVAVFGVRASDMAPDRYDRLWRWSYRLEARLARRADAVIVNSEAGRLTALERGVSERKLFVIRNGVDSSLFRFDAAAGRRFREDWRFGDGDIVVGIVARFDPMKDHATFLAALALARERVTALRAVLVGDGPDALRDEIEGTARRLGLGDAVRWVGWQRDMVAVYSGIDLLCLSSAYGEGTPNAVAEAMACERPCIVTNVGDSAHLISGVGRVVPRRAPEALAAAIVELASLPEEERRRMGRAARKRVAEAFSLDRLVRATEAVLRRVISNDALGG